MQSVHRRRDQFIWMISLFALTVVFAGACASAKLGESGSRTSIASNPGPDAIREALLVGAWRVLETGVRTGTQPWDVRPARQGGLFVFSRQHYSFFSTRGDDPRPRFADANRPTEAERAATYDTFIAGAGSYTFDGKTAGLKSDFSKNPNEMTGELWRWEAEFAGDTVRFVFVNPPFLPGRDWRLTLVRLE